MFFARQKFQRIVRCTTHLLVVCALCGMPALAHQSNPDYATSKKAAYDMLTQNKLDEAEKAFETLAIAPEAQSDADVFAKLGFLLFGKLSLETDEQQRKELTERSRAALTKAKELGDQNAVSAALLDAMKNGPPAVSHFSDVKDADEAMHEAELIYLKGDLAAAVTFYQKALAADSRLYEAALDIGDCDFKIPGKLDEAPQWFAKAVAINPDRETAYRYWADVLMKQGKPEDARVKSIDAYISEPGNGLAIGGFTTWAKGAHVKLAHPSIVIPVKVEYGGGENKMTLDEGAMGSSMAQWILYGGERLQWPKTKFQQEYPTEKTYRHSLKEESSALRLAITDVNPKSKNIDPTIATLIRLDKDGVLEAFVLLAHADNGIVQDYAAFRRDHRDLLRRYIVNWVITNGGTQKATN